MPLKQNLNEKTSLSDNNLAIDWDEMMQYIKTVNANAAKLNETIQLAGEQTRANSIQNEKEFGLFDQEMESLDFTDLDFTKAESIVQDIKDFEVERVYQLNTLSYLASIETAAIRSSEAALKAMKSADNDHISNFRIAKMEASIAANHYKELLDAHKAATKEARREAFKARVTETKLVFINLGIDLEVLGESIVNGFTQKFGALNDKTGEMAERASEQINVAMQSVERARTQLSESFERARTQLSEKITTHVVEPISAKMIDSADKIAKFGSSVDNAAINLIAAGSNRVVQLSDSTDAMIDRAQEKTRNAFRFVANKNKALSTSVSSGIKDMLDSARATGGNVQKACEKTVNIIRTASDIPGAVMSDARAELNAVKASSVSNIKQAVNVGRAMMVDAKEKFTQSYFASGAESLEATDRKVYDMIHSNNTNTVEQGIKLAYKEGAGLTVSQLESMLTHESPFVRATAVKHGDLSDEQLKRSMNDEHWKVRCAVVLDKNVVNDKLINDPVKFVAEAANKISVGSPVDMTDFKSNSSHAPKPVA